MESIVTDNEQEDNFYNPPVFDTTGKYRIYPQELLNDPENVWISITNYPKIQQTAPINDLDKLHPHH